MKEKRTLNRRDFLKAASFVAAGGLLASCAPSRAITPEAPATEAPAAGAAPTQAAGETPTEAPTAVPPASNPEAIQWWVGWGELVPYFDSFKQMDQYKALMGNNDVEMKPSINDEALFTAIAAGVPPDIASNISYLDVFSRDVCVDIADWVKKSTIIKKEDFISGNWDGGFYKGKEYGVPTLECFVRFGLNYNTKLVTAAGLDPEKPPVTWGETLEWHKKLTTFDSAGNLKTIGLDPLDAEGSAISDGFLAARSWGFKWFDEYTGKFDLGNAKMAEAFDTYAEFYKVVGPDKMAGMRSVAGNDTWGGSYNTEMQAMIIEGYWHPGETQAQKPEVAKYNRATWVPVPEDRKGQKVQGTGGHYVVFFKEAKKTEEGFKFAEFLTTGELCDKIFKELGWLPAYKPYLSTADPKAYPGLEFYFNSVKEATDMQPAIACPISSFVQTTYDQLSDDVNRGKLKGADAAAEFQKSCEKEYKNAGFSS
jgi:multiple sugar transport system substrate-binding protein